MADGTKIEWTDTTWNPVTGCSVVSPGCTNCYAMRLAGGRLRNHPSRTGLTDLSKAGPVWNGAVRFNVKQLDQPLRWRKPRMIFVCAHGDLFHEAVYDEWIDRVFAVMALCPRHTFQVLTKRPQRMRDYLAVMEHEDQLERWCDAAVAISGDHNAEDRVYDIDWPLPNVWLGVSAEDRERADERIPPLLETPAAVRFVSCEPLLGPIDLQMIGGYPCEQRARLEPGCWNTLSGEWWPAVGNPDWEAANVERDLPHLDWVIVGGESGPGARDMDPAWARSLRDQSRGADVPFFMKQMAKKAPIPADLKIGEWPDVAV